MIFKFILIRAKVFFLFNDFYDITPELYHGFQNNLELKDKTYNFFIKTVTMIFLSFICLKMSEFDAESIIK